MSSSDILSRLRRALASNDEQTSMDLRDQVLSAGATPLSHVAPRQSATIQGTLVSLTQSPVHGTHWLRAELSDGSGSLVLIWMGRRVVPGIKAGTTLQVTGRVARDQVGRLVMYNPRYELIG